MVLYGGKSEDYFGIILIIKSLCCLQKPLFGGKLVHKVVHKG